MGIAGSQRDGDAVSEGDSAKWGAKVRKKSDIYKKKVQNLDFCTFFVGHWSLVVGSRTGTLRDIAERRTDSVEKRAIGLPWNGRKNAKLLMAVKIPPNVTTGIQFRTNERRTLAHGSREYRTK